MDHEQELVTTHVEGYLENYLEEIMAETEELERAFSALRQIKSRSRRNSNFLNSHRIKQTFSKTCRDFNGWHDIDYIFGENWPEEEQELYQNLVNDRIDSGDVQELVEHLEETCRGQRNFISGVEAEKRYVSQRAQEIVELYSRVLEADSTPTAAIYDLERIVEERNTETDPLFEDIRDARDIVYHDFEVEEVSDTNYPVLRDAGFLLYKIDNSFEENEQQRSHLSDVEGIGI